MEIKDTLTILLQTTLAFVLANGDGSKATNISLAHLPEESKVTIPWLRINRDLCCSAC